MKDPSNDSEILKRITGCGKLCSSCTKKDLRWKGRTGKAFSSSECVVAHALAKLGMEYKDHLEMDALCAFNAGSEREADFYLPEYDLYIEVKGAMTHYEYNKLMWLVEESGEKVYVLVDDNADWNGLHDARFETAAEKKRYVLIKQIKELMALKKGILKADDLVELSKLRLREYVITRSADNIRWSKKIIEQKCDDVELEIG